MNKPDCESKRFACHDNEQLPGKRKIYKNENRIDVEMDGTVCRDCRECHDRIKHILDPKQYY